MPPILSSLLLLSLLSHPDSLDALKRDAVTFTGGKMIIESYGLIKPYGDTTAAPQSFRFHAEAPDSGLISRDHFAMLSFYVFSIKIMQMGHYSGIERPPGKVDIEFDYRMTRDGVVSEEQNRLDNSVKKDSGSWKEFFEQVPMP